tara:strand:+ start:592 stop:840 length:249 start_codon:yes stop_codon:yes gene_type:complete
MSWTLSDNPHFDSGDLVKYCRVEYFATDTDYIDSYAEEKIGMFLNFWDMDSFDACRVYVFSDQKIITVSVRDLSLLSKNKKS